MIGLRVTIKFGQRGLKWPVLSRKVSEQFDTKKQSAIVGIVLLCEPSVVNFVSKTNGILGFPIFPVVLSDERLGHDKPL